MMTSIFSSFDALSAELFVKKLGQSPGCSQAVVADLKTGGVNNAAVGEVPPPHAMKKTAATEQRRRPRFAPELDGIYSFETIIPS
ncbi:unnamed protein product [Cuscuta campestris]|uniref:Uncharacterized protein n=1 Tax=Cuscuta campestris TaxID=132261 RepID=A0A484KN81_9ASTE|nr:unnamed protein product [Cuscuta campestris]